MSKSIELTGQKFNKLTVIERCGKDKYGKILWRCRCDCGNETITLGRSLVNGHCKSCGCIHKDIKRKSATYKGFHNQRIYTIWRGMISRCENPNNQNYAEYGGRGISVCLDWKGDQGFFNFVIWSLNNYYSKDFSIDRINNNGNYEPNNCRWVDWHTQANNRRKPTYITNQYGKWGYGDAPARAISD